MHYRRDVVATAGLALVAGLAGCSDGGEAGDPEATETDEDSGGDDGSGGEQIPEGIESESLPDEGDDTYLEGVEPEEHDRTDHVSSQADIEYDRVPPTGGPHYPSVVEPGVYDEPKSLGKLVHNLEHGHVVVYYDPDAITAAARESLERFADQYDDTWAAMVVVPHPGDDPQADYLLTAWGKRLTMDGYDARVVRAFLAEYVGRGPEYPVR
jgi:hypothetical protein